MPSGDVLADIDGIINQILVPLVVLIVGIKKDNCHIDDGAVALGGR
jgi:hypothetical protein